jgi:hypothetical protein
VTVETRPCRRSTLKRGACDGAATVVEAGNLNGIEVRWWVCGACGCEDREELAEHDQPALDLGV